MNAALIAAVVDTLLPGDSGGPEGETPLPAGSAAGLDLDALAKAYHALFDAIAKQAGSAEAFIIADNPARLVAVQAIERAMPDAFRSLLSTLLAEYYESAPVLTAMGWRSGPPQPQGHEMPDNDGTMAERLNRVRTRSQHWRGA